MHPKRYLLIHQIIPVLTVFVLFIFLYSPVITANDKTASAGNDFPSVRVSVVSQLFNDRDRTLSAVIEKISKAAREHADVTLCPLLRPHLVNVFLDRRGDRQIVFNAVKSGCQHHAEAEIRIGGGVRRPEFDAGGFFAGKVDRYPDAGAPISLGVSQIDRGLIAGDQPFIRVGGGGTEGQQGWCVFE